MEKLHFSINIQAPKERVWDTMLNDKTYREWTSAFAEGSYYEGNWEKGNRILFLGPSGDGMVSRIKENRPQEFLSIEHLGFIKNGVEDTESEEVKAWFPAFEDYTFKESDGMTEVQVDMDTTEEYKEMFEKMWPNALEKLKTLCER